MTVLGIRVVMPTARSAALALGVAAVICAVVLMLTWLTGTPSDWLAALFGFVLAGTTAAACGISVAEHGWRAFVILVALGSVLALAGSALAVLI